jgi:small subunit ribosomal protein S29
MASANLPIRTICHLLPRPSTLPPSQFHLSCTSTSVPFSTTSPSLFATPKKTGTRVVTNQMVKGRKTTFTLKKKAPVARIGRPIAPGERKAVRKRIVLSNIIALEVQDLVDLSPENLSAEEMNGRVVGIPGPIVDQLRAVGAFKTKQHWGLFRRPGMIFRREAAELAQTMDEAAEKKRTTRAIVTGEQGTGKSVFLLQAMAMAFLKGWIVLAIPEGNPPFPSLLTSRSYPHC